MRPFSSLAKVIFLIALLIRLFLVIYNREANDDHVEVVSWIVDKHSIPEKPDCWSCFQPKLFYLISAAAVKTFNLTTKNERIVTMQFINFLFGFFILLFILKFINRQFLPDKVKVLLFAFFAFNPCLMGINVQSTNDTLEILAGVLTIYFAELFFSKFTAKAFSLVVVSLLAGALTKASGLILFFVVSIIFFLKIVSAKENKERKYLVSALVILITIFITIVPFAGGYYHNYKKYDSFTLSTFKKDNPPEFFHDTFISRPGVKNMFGSFFTFRYLDMIRQPYINNEEGGYPLHRTSLWSQLYGRTVYLHFDQWPGSWQTKHPVSINIGRVLIAFGIIPLSIFLLGLAIGIRKFFSGLYKNARRCLNHSETHLHIMVTLAFLAAAIKYSYDYRDFSAMKSIYLFPGLISYVKLFSDGIGTLTQTKIYKSISILLIVMIVLSVWDELFLIQQQYKLFIR
jgi:hypothetical protein